MLVVWGFWIMSGFFFLANAYNLFGPPPEDNIMVLFVSFVVLQVIVVRLAWWVDGNRVGEGLGFRLWGKLSLGTVSRLEGVYAELLLFKQFY